MENKDYITRFDAQKNYKKILFRPGKGLQSTELNDLQEQVIHQMRRVSDSVLKDGDIVSGGKLAINKETGATKVSESTVYLRGYVRELPEGTLTLPVSGIHYIGIWLTEKIISEVEDPALRDPATGTHNYHQPGAGRLQVLHEWGLKTDKKADGTPHDGTFYPVFRIENCVHIIKQPPPQLNAITVALARFDRESNGGNYVVEGMEVMEGGKQDATKDGKTEKHQVISIREGKAHIQGFSVEFKTALRKLYPIDPDLRTVSNEPHRVTLDANNKMRINTSYSPIHNISEINASVEITKELTHGGYTGCLDSMGQTSVVKIVSVKQGNTTYTENTDYKRTGDQVDWSLSGEEPNPGSKYEVTFQYRAQLQPEVLDETGFTVSNVVEDTDVYIDYQWRMPRIDLITLDKEGEVRRLKGIPNPNQPNVPQAPSGQFSLAEIRQNWSDTKAPVIVNHAVRTVSMSDLKSMQEQITDLYDLVAIERLRNDANAQDPAAKKGVFVDPFLDDDMRDQGITQTAAIINGELVLPITVMVSDLNKDNNQIETLAYERERLLNQPMHTGSMKVNPYQAFEPIPPKVTLYPQVDRWTVSQTQWSSPITQRFYTGSRFGRRTRVTTSSSTQTVSRRTQTVQYLRQRSVSFVIKGFGPQEELKEILFDSIRIATTAKADANGEVRGSFQVPNGVPSGTKSVIFNGKVESRAETTYTGRGSITITELRNVTTITTMRYDPLAQTFTLTESRHLVGIDLWFVKKGQSDVRVQIRETTVGLPNQTIISETIMKAADIKTNGSATSFNFAPVYAEAGVEYAIVVLTDDPDHEVRIAEIGKFDNTRGWVTSQPFQVGVLLSSSNAQTWTPHQNMDLTFSLYAAKFTQTSRTISFGKVAVSQVSDLMALASVQRTSSETDLRFVISDTVKNKTYELQDNQVMNLTERIDNEVDVEARLTGSDKYSPVLFPGAQITQGKMEETADYVTRAISCGDDSKLTVCYEGLMGSDSSIEAFAEIKSGTGESATTTWTKLTSPTGKPVGDNWIEQKYTKTGLNQEKVRIKLILKGNAKDRPRVRRLRVIAT